MNKQIVICLIFVFIQIIYGENTDTKWVCNGRKCYFLMRNQRGPYENTDRYCHQVRGRAATIHSPEEQQFLENYLRQIGYDSSVWIGGTRRNTKFAWRNDGVLIDGNVYSNWASNHPTNLFAKACMKMNGYSEPEPGKWVEDFCFSSHGVLCERPAGHDNDNDNDNDNDDDDDNNDNCCNRIERNLKALEKRMEKRFRKMENELVKVARNMDRIYDRVKKFEDRRNDILEEQTERLYEIQSNFTGIANVLDYFTEQIYKLQYEMNNNHPSTDVDLQIVKRELTDYFKEELKRAHMDEVVNDIKLSYVNFRRALKMRKDGRWVTLGYV